MIEFTRTFGQCKYWFRHDSNSKYALCCKQCNYGKEETVDRNYFTRIYIITQHDISNTNKQANKRAVPSKFSSPPLSPVPDMFVMRVPYHFHFAHRDINPAPQVRNTTTPTFRNESVTQDLKSYTAAIYTPRYKIVEF